MWDLKLYQLYFYQNFWSLEEKVIQFFIHIINRVGIHNSFKKFLRTTFYLSNHLSSQFVFTNHFLSNFLKSFITHLLDRSNPACRCDPHYLTGRRTGLLLGRGIDDAVINRSAKVSPKKFFELVQTINSSNKFDQFESTE